MSIPKEPRQLMINLMYIVLTALLALNVSAEILQAFFSIDESLGESKRVVAHSNAQMMEAIREEAEAYEQYRPYVGKAERLQQLTEALQKQLQQTRQALIKAAGGLDDNEQPVRETDKDIPTRMLVEEGRASELKRAVQDTRQAMLQLVEDEQQRRLLSASIPLQIPALPENAEADSWEAYTFQQMPVAAVLPILHKFENDAEIAEAALLNHFLSQMGTQIVMDAYEPVIAAEQSYVIRGERYQSDIFLSAYSSTADNIRVYVDGQPMPVEGGKARFNATARQLGTQQHRALIELQDPISGEVQRFEKTFRYQVGERSVAVAANKMNVLYIGVENPMTISAAGVPSAEVQVSGSGVRLRHQGGSQYIAEATRTGDARITVSGGGLEPATFAYRVKKIPDPVMELGGKRGGQLPAGTFRAQQGIIPVLENFDFEARCEVAGFEVVRRPEQGDISVATNSGARFSSSARRLIDAATHGDTYYFEDIRVRCPGDDGPSRQLNSLIFKIR